MPGTIAIGILPTVAPVLLSPALMSFRQQWPAVSLSVWTDSNALLLEKLKAGDVDLVVGRLSEPEAMHGLSFEQIYREPLAVVVRREHPLTLETPLTPALLARFVIVVPPFGTLIRQSAESVLTAFGAHALTALVETLSVSLGRSLAMNNDAVWFVPAGAVEQDIALGLLAALPMPFAGTDEPIGLIRRNDAARTPVEETLVDALREAGRSRAGSK
jgi:LysR family pca operon transcriptional activator